MDGVYCIKYRLEKNEFYLLQLFVRQSLAFLKDDHLFLYPPGQVPMHLLELQTH